MILAGKRILVTGAAGALGKAVVGALLAEGARVLAVDMNEVGLASVAGPGVMVRRVDLLDAAEVSAALLDEDIDGLAAIAGGFSMGDGADELGDDWDRMHDINVTTLRHTLAAATGAVRRNGGSVVTVGARNGLKGPPAMSAYAAAKASVHRLTESLNAEGVRANAVLPSIIDTPANRAAMPDADHTAWVAPDALASVIVFLLADASEAVRGALIPVYGEA